MIGIIGAMKIEVEYILEKLEKKETEIVSSVVFTKGEIKGNKVVVAACSPGKVNAAMVTQAMIIKFNPDVIINTGCAGSLCAEATIGSVVIATGAVQYDMDTSEIGDPKGFISGLGLVNIPCNEEVAGKLLETAAKREIHHMGGIIASGDRFMSDSEMKKAIVAEFGASAVDMETAAIAHVCALNQVPFTAVRCISDNAGDGSAVDYNTFVAVASKTAIALLTDFIVNA